jgi:hypothetical protein
MKFKTSTLLLATLLAVALGTFTLPAQVAGIYSPNSISAGGVLVVPANNTNLFYTYALTNGVLNGTWTTNNGGAAYNTPISFATQTNLLVNVSTYDYPGITWAYLSGSNATLDVYASYDNGTSWPSNKIASYAGPATTTSTFTTNTFLDCRGVTHLAFVTKNASTLALSNVVISVNLKSPTLFTLPPGNYGRTPGTPITVPNFP